MSADPAATPHPLSLFQERLWLLHCLHPEAALLTVPMVLHLAGPIDAASVHAALRAVVRRHDALDGWIERRDDTFVQVPDGARVELPQIDAGALAPAGTAMEALPMPDLTDNRLLAARLVWLPDGTAALQLMIHHAAFDGMSTPILVAEVSAAYQAARAGADPAAALPPLPARYADFAAWQRAQVDTPQYRDRLDRWVHALAGVTPLDLATDRPRRLPVSLRGATHRFVLGEDLAEPLRRFAASRGVTLFMVLAGVFAMTLARRAGYPDDVLLGVPHSARIKPVWAPLIGLFANMVPLRVRLDGDPSLADVVHRVRAETLRVFADGDTPFDRIVHAVGQPYDPTRMPLCPVSFQIAHDARPDGGGTAAGVRHVFVPRQASEFELSMYVAGGPDLPAAIEYASDLFTAQTVADIGAEFGELCRGLLAAPERRGSAVDQHGPRRAALVERGRGRPVAPPAGTLPDLVDRWVTDTPDAVAVAAGEARLTYRELRRRSRALAGRLVAAGVRPGDLVLVAVGRDHHMPVALLGTLLARAGYLPLNDELPETAVAATVSAARPVAVLADRAHRAVGDRFGLPTVTVDSAEDDPAPAEPAAPVSGSPAEIAYVMGTSGTTGQPKLIAVPQCGVISLAYRPGYLDVAPGDVVAQLAPVSFDAATFEIWVALLNGATLAIAPSTRLSPGQLAKFLRSHRVGIVHLTAGLFRVVADERPELFGGVRHLLTGGDVVSAAHVRRIRRARPDLRITACYGPTEATVFSSVASLRDVPPTASVPIGTPIPGRTMHVVDRWLRPVATGVPGEIAVGGDGLALGYLGQPGLTAERFVPDPFTPGGRLYRTGDRGRADGDGVVEFLGRDDRQLKIRGYRVEPVEVESVLRDHPAVVDCVVRPRSIAGEPALVGYLVCAGSRGMDAGHDGADPGLDEADLRAWARARLPEYCVPARMVRLAAFPVSGNGKIDLRRLDETPLPPPAVAPARLAAGPTALAIREVWQSVLGVADIGLDVDFFDAGGHSLAALRACGRLEARLGRAIPIDRLFAYPTARQLAEWIDTQPAGASGTGDIPASDDAALMELTGASPDELAALLAALDSPAPDANRDRAW